MAVLKVLIAPAENLDAVTSMHRAAYNLNVSSIPEALMLSSDLCRHQAQTQCRNIRADKTCMHIKYVCWGAE